MRALPTITLFLCAVSVFAQQHRIGTSGPEPSPLQAKAVGITAHRFLMRAAK